MPGRRPWIESGPRAEDAGPDAELLEIRVQMLIGAQHRDVDMFSGGTGVQFVAQNILIKLF